MQAFEVENGTGELPPAQFDGVDPTYRQGYRNWRVSEAKGSKDPVPQSPQARKLERGRSRTDTAGLVLGGRRRVKSCAEEDAVLFRCGDAADDEEVAALTYGDMVNNMLLSVIGSTVLGVAAQMPVGGWVIAPLVLAAASVIVGEMLRLVNGSIEMIEQLGDPVTAYSDFAGGALGPVGKRLSMMTSIFAMSGMCVGTMILSAQNLNFILPINAEWPGSSASGDSHGSKWWALGLSSTTLYFAFGDTKLLAKASALGPAVCIACIVCAWLSNFGALQEKMTMWPSECTGDYYETGEWNFGEFVGMATYAVFCFAVVVTVPALRAQMRVAAEIVPASQSAFAVSVLLFFSIMFTGYAALGRHAPPNLIEALRENRPEGFYALNRPWETGEASLIGKIFAFFIAANLIVSDTIFIGCLVGAIEKSFFLFRTRMGAILMRIVVALLRFYVVIAVPQFLAVSKLTSSLFCVCNNIILPCVGYYALGGRSKESGGRQLFHLFALLVGLTLASVGTRAALGEIFNPPTQSAPGSELRKDASDDCLRQACNAGLHMACDKLGIALMSV